MQFIVPDSKLVNPWQKSRPFFFFFTKIPLSNSEVIQCYTPRTFYAALKKAQNTFWISYFCRTEIPVIKAIYVF